MVWADNLERTSDRTRHRQAGAALGLDVGADAARSECKKGLEWEEGKKGAKVIWGPRCSRCTEDRQEGTTKGGM